VIQLSTFTLFGDLPPELQLLIWEAARPAPRFIILQGRPQNPSRSRWDDQDIYSNAKVPALLHTCRNSRRIALKWYRLSFGNPTFPPRVYFDWEEDCLHARCRNCPTINECKYIHLVFSLLEVEDRYAPKSLFLYVSRLVLRHALAFAEMQFPGVVNFVIAEPKFVDCLIYKGQMIRRNHSAFLKAACIWVGLADLCLSVGIAVTSYLTYPPTTIWEACSVPFMLIYDTLNSDFLLFVSISTAIMLLLLVL